jgi:hypothetical protein
MLQLMKHDGGFTSMAVVVADVAAAVFVDSSGALYLSSLSLSGYSYRAHIN